MKHFVKFVFDKTGYSAKANEIQKKIGIQTIDYSVLSFKNRKGWTMLTMFWIELASLPYFQKRVLKIRESIPDYSPDIAGFEPVFYRTPKQTITFLEKLDQLFLKATNHVCPDGFFQFTFPPDIGPFEDLLNTLISQNKTIPYQILSPLVLDLGLTLSQKNKTLYDYHTLSPEDMEFLAHFAFFLSQHPQYLSFINQYEGNEMALRVLYLSFPPKHRLHRLSWDEKLVTERFESSQIVMQAYDKSPETVSLIALTDKEMDERQLKDS